MPVLRAAQSCPQSCHLSAQATEGLSRSESFSYDQLHRLTGSMRFTNDIVIPGETTSYSYDALGSFEQKSDFAVIFGNR